MFYRMQRLFRAALIFVAGTVCVAIGFTLTAIRDHRRETAFEHVQTDNFKLIVLHEDEPEVAKQALQKFSSIDDKQPLLTIQEPTETRLFYATDVDNPRYVQKVVRDNKEVSRSVIRAIFKGPGAIKKTQHWLGKNSYTQSDFVIEKVTSERNDTVSIYPANGDSRIAINGYFSVGSRDYIWDGGRIIDCGKGFTSEAQQKKHVQAERTRYINSLAQIAE